MTPEALYADLQSLRETFRRKMNKSAEAAQKAASEDNMDIVSMYSTESERFRTAFVALNQAIKIVDDFFATAPA